MTQLQERIERAVSRYGYDPHKYSAGTSWHAGKTMSADELNREAQQASGPKSAEHAEAGNYRKGHVRIHGMNISIETPKGGIRRGVSRNGASWEREMKSHYGYIKRTISLADGDHIDVFIGPHPEHPIVYVVDQVHPASGEFDEHKCLIGFKSKEDAKAAYHENYPDDWKGYHGIKAMHSRDFKDWIKNGDTKRPVSGVDRDRANVAAFKYSKSSDSGGTWITLKPHGDEGKGVHVELSASGEIVKGPSEFHGKHISELSVEHKRASTLVPHAHEFLLQQHDGREKAKQSARRITGLTAGDIARHENAYRDHSTVEGFDTSSRTVAMEHGELGIDPDAHDTPARIWELIREGAIPKPTKNSPEVHQLAKEWAKGKKPAEQTYAHDDDWDNWDSRADVAAFKYAKANGDQGRWITLKPHGDDSDDYVHVKIGDDGRIEAGPAGMAKKGIHNLSDFGKSHEERSGQRTPETDTTNGPIPDQPDKVDDERRGKRPSKIHRDAAVSHLNEYRKKVHELVEKLGVYNDMHGPRPHQTGTTYAYALNGGHGSGEKHPTPTVGHLEDKLSQGLAALKKDAQKAIERAYPSKLTAENLGEFADMKPAAKEAEESQKKPGIPGMQKSLLDDDGPGQKQLFDYVPPKKGDTKSKSESAGGSTLEKIGDEQKEREEASKPMSGQRDLLSEDLEETSNTKVGTKSPL
jgi:hypothetical protein